jgi:hypothetical protein
MLTLKTVFEFPILSPTSDSSYRDKLVAVQVNIISVFCEPEDTYEYTLWVKSWVVERQIIRNA